MAMWSSGAPLTSVASFSYCSNRHNKVGVSHQLHHRIRFRFYSCDKPHSSSRYRHHHCLQRSNFSSSYTSRRETIYFVASALNRNLISLNDSPDQECPDVRNGNVVELSQETVGEVVILEEEKNEEKFHALSEKKELLWRAIKLPIYSVALIPLSVGSAVAFWQTGMFHIGRFSALLVSSMLVIAWLNLSNDAYDAETGVDKEKKESVVNMTGSREGVLISAYACLVFGLLGLLWGAWQAQNMQIFVLLAGAICCGYIYQCPPFRLSYLGVGEPLCFTAFGPLATTAFYLSQSTGSLQVSGTILAAATLVGITTTLILFCSHFHQIEGDRLVGKMSPLVRLGTEKGKDVVKMSVTGLYSLILLLTATKTIPYPCVILSLMTAPIGKLVVDFVSNNHDDKEKIFLAKYFCVRLHAAMGAALTLGFFVASRMRLVL